MAYSLYNEGSLFFLFFFFFGLLINKTYQLMVKPSKAMVRAYIINKSRVSMKSHVRNQLTSQTVVSYTSSCLLGTRRQLADLGVSSVTLSPGSDTNNLSHYVIS